MDEPTADDSSTTPTARSSTGSAAGPVTGSLAGSVTGSVDVAGKGPVPGMPAPDQLLVALARLGQAVRLGARRNAGPQRLSPLGADIVTFLGGDDRPRRQSDVVHALASTAPTVSDAVRALLSRGLLGRERDVEDARAVTLRLSDAGREEYRRLTQVPVDLADAVSAVPEADRGVVLRSAVTMMTLLQERRAIPVSRMCATCQFFRRDAHAGARPHHCAFVDAAFADVELRVECPDHLPVAD